MGRHDRWLTPQRAGNILVTGYECPWAAVTISLMARLLVCPSNMIFKKVSDCYFVMSGSARVRVCVVPRSVHRAAIVKLRAFVPCVHSGLLHRLHAEPAPGLCA
ncbi:hypothetical protein EVAR_46097_1 [Eumeta japonica]|uniref:Uncharacterized protein n=1 Tax=Eumeta variegata TaxID=151549 RepID=A0A4C1XFD7_EUMVA|nr:hypothetical protein EVAR_46097_1 [Eumeta japonica]